MIRFEERKFNSEYSFAWAIQRAFSGWSQGGRLDWEVLQARLRSR
jgi:hypothetical protein